MQADAKRTPMSVKRIVLAIVAGFVLLGIGRYLISQLWLAAAYGQHTELWRAPQEMRRAEQPRPLNATARSPAGLTFTPKTAQKHI